jgi:undecaprenyl-diphosphatase
MACRPSGQDRPITKITHFAHVSLGLAPSDVVTRLRAMRSGRVYAFAALLLGLSLALVLTGVGEEADGLPYWQALVLGLVQGATELLPISSSGHLVLVPWLGDWTFLEENESFNHTFDVALHLGTMLAVGGYFLPDLLAMLRGWFRTLRTRRIETSDERLAWIIVVATIPAALVGLVFEDTITTHLGEPWQIALALAVGAIVLWWADRRPTTREASSHTLREALFIGVAQALALMPGVSRSGITISAGRFLRLDRDAAARLSFLLLVPTVLGAVLLKGVKDVLLGDLPAGWQGPFVVGVLAAWGSGLLAIQWLLGYVRRHDYGVFVVYRLLAAAAILLLIASGVRAATF